MPDEHARLSPSAAARWLSCPASVLLIEANDTGIEEAPSPWAVEGTEAHELAYLTASREFGLIEPAEYVEKLGEWELRNAHRGSEDISEMRRHVADFVEVTRKALRQYPNSQLRLEKRVYTGVEHCWGTADVIIFSPRHVHVIDLKYGAGVRVDARNNSQLRLYGCGALELYGDVLGDTETVTTSIFQPRASNAANGGLSSETISADELRAWRDYEVKPVAARALKPGAEFGPSDKACRFCPLAGSCRARHDAAMAQDFGTDTALLSPEEVAHVLSMAPQIRSWLDSVESMALQKIYEKGEHIPGYKVVLGHGRRSVPEADIPHAIQILIDKGFTAEQVARFSMKPLGQLEKLVGKKELAEYLSPVMVKTAGGPALVPESDNRPPANPNQEAARVFRAADEIEE